jgi:glyoxylase-like metal-dependent hydrolase (beta-lactamase superfamily II)
VARVDDWIERSGKRLAYIYATHRHGDHWFGTDPRMQRFPEAVPYANEGTIAMMHEQATEGRAERWGIDLTGLECWSTAVIGRLRHVREIPDERTA